MSTASFIWEVTLQMPTETTMTLLVLAADVAEAWFAAERLAEREQGSVMQVMPVAGQYRVRRMPGRLELQKRIDAAPWWVVV